MASKALTSVIVAARAQHTATVIFLHGLGDSGEGWAPLAHELGGRLPHVKFIFPNAPSQKVTLNMGMRMPSWYDIKSLDENRGDDEQGLFTSAAQVTSIIGEEVAAGIPASRIVLGGFSQGCALSLVTGLTTEYKLAGLCCLSGYLPLRSKIFTMASEANQNTPIFWGHGDADGVVAYAWGKASADLLMTRKYAVDFHSYPNMGHGSCADETADVFEFLKSALP